MLLLCCNIFRDFHALVLTVNIFRSSFFFVNTNMRCSFYLTHVGYPRSEKQQPDTIILRGVPSRWFAEPRVSSKPSMLVTHTIFSAFGKIRWVL